MTTIFDSVKDKVYSWYNSLADRDKQILSTALSVLLPVISIYFYIKQSNERSSVEQKLLSLPTLSQLKAQIFSLEKQKIYYNQEISKLNALLLNPSIKYAYNTELNQIPMILNNEVTYYGGYLTSFQEETPLRIVVNQDGLKSNFANMQKAKKNKKPAINRELFGVELLPIKFNVAVSKANVLSFLNDFNSPNNIYPLLLINNISLGFGKNSNCTGGVLQENNQYTINTAKSYSIKLSSPVNVCISGYAIDSISKVPNQQKLLKGNKNGK